MPTTTPPKPPAATPNPPARRLPVRRAARPWRAAAVLLLLLAAAAGGGWWWQQRAAQPAAGAGLNAAAGASAATGGAGQDAGRAGASAGGRPGAGGGGRRFGGGAGAAQPVSVQAARRQDIRVTVNAIGSIAASNTAIVRAQVGGTLQKLFFREGQQVKAGQLLAQIDPRAFEATLGQAAGNLAKDQAQLDNARIDLDRYRGLLAKDAIPMQQLDTQQSLVRQLEGTVKSDQGSVDSARLQLSYTKVTAPIAGRVGLKQADLGNIVQASDANGIVTIAQTRPIALTFAVPSQQLPAVMRRLRAGEAIAVDAWSRDGKTRLATGRVETVDNAIDTTTDTIKVKALFANADDALFPNQAVNVVLQLDVLQGVLAVPQAAVLRGSQGFYVYVVNDDGTVSTRVVQPGDADGGWVQVDEAGGPRHGRALAAAQRGSAASSPAFGASVPSSPASDAALPASAPVMAAAWAHAAAASAAPPAASGAAGGQRQAPAAGLRAGERVVIDGTDRLRDGAKVEVIAADPSQRAGASAPAGGGRRGGGRRASDAAGGNGQPPADGRPPGRGPPP